MLKEQQKKLEEVLQINKDNNNSNQQLENIMLNIANNYSRDQISQIFGSEDNDEILNKLNQALCLEESFYKNQNNSVMIKEIE